MDFPFQGELTGPKLKGQIAGRDYVLLRGDGVAKLHMHAVITTDDGERIALYADGTSIGEAESMTAQLRGNITLHTAAQKYCWVNRLQFWAIGQMDSSIGKIKAKVYAA